MTPFQFANLLEAGLWTGIAIAFAGFAIAQPRQRRRQCLIAAVTFLLFGVSDVVETQTGAWYRPWWLLAWKALCVGVLLVLLIEHIVRRQGRRATDDRPEH